MSKTLIKPSLPILDRSNPLTQGLVACYPFFERGGTKLRDISGRNNNGILFNTNWVRTPRGYGLEFNSAYINIGNSTNFSFGTGDFTISVWFNPTLTTDIRSLIVKDVAGARQWRFIIAENKLQFNSFPSGNIVLSISNVILNQWNCGIITRQSGVIRLYLNGKLEATATIPDNYSTTSNVFIGKEEYVGYPYYFSGSMEEVFISRSPFSSKQAATLYADPWSIYRTSPLNTVGSIPPITTYLRNLALMGVGQ